MAYNPSIHKRKSTRLKDYDYSQPGLYFITICTFEKESIFGEIVKQQMRLNEGGKSANRYWLEIPKHYPQVKLHAHIIMPNHVHGIIEITSETTHKHVGAVGAENIQPLRNIQPLQNFQPSPKAKFQTVTSGSIGAIIRGYKIAVTKWFRQNSDIHRVWQRNYYDHIIRDEKSFVKISEYIMANPVLWIDDKYFV